MIEPYILEYKNLVKPDGEIDEKYLNKFSLNVLLDVYTSKNKIVIIKLIDNSGFEVLINILDQLTCENIYNKIFSILLYDLNRVSDSK